MLQLLSRMGKVGRTVMNTAVLAALVGALLLVLPPGGNLDTIHMQDARSLHGPLSPNTLLNDAVRLFEGEIFGPECVVSRRDDELFVSMQGGAIVRVFGDDFDRVEKVAQIGPECASQWDERRCGRPLGLRFARDGKLLVADAYLGIFRIDVDTGSKEMLVDSNVAIDGFKPKLIDDLDEGADGAIYWSDASTVADLSTGAREILVGPTGRLLKYDPESKSSVVLMDKLLFANGVQLSPAEDFVLVSESFRYRVHRYWLRGPKAGTHEVFADGLPGVPDNIRPRRQGGYYVALPSVRRPITIDPCSLLGRWPRVRLLLARVCAAILKACEVVSGFYWNQYIAMFADTILNLETYSEYLTGNSCIILELDEEGNIVSSLQGTSGVVRLISHASQVGDKLFFGSPFNKYLGMIPIQKITTNRAASNNGTDTNIHQNYNLICNDTSKKVENVIREGIGGIEKNKIDREEEL